MYVKFSEILGDTIEVTSYCVIERRGDSFQIYSRMQDGAGRDTGFWQVETQFDLTSPWSATQYTETLSRLGVPDSTALNVWTGLQCHYNPEVCDMCGADTAHKTRDEDGNHYYCSECFGETLSALTVNSEEETCSECGMEDALIEGLCSECYGEQEYHEEHYSSECVDCGSPLFRGVCGYCERKATESIALGRTDVSGYSVRVTLDKTGFSKILQEGANLPKFYVRGIVEYVTPGGLQSEEVTRCYFGSVDSLEGAYLAFRREFWRCVNVSIIESGSM